MKTEINREKLFRMVSVGVVDEPINQAYDIISTTVYEQSTKDLAFHIGGKYAISQVEPNDFRNAAKEIGIGERIAMRRFSDMSSNFRPALSRAAQELSDAGYRAAKEMENRILQNGGISFMQ